jgi:hypothetical protein
MLDSGFRKEGEIVGIFLTFEETAEEIAGEWDDG